MWGSKDCTLTEQLVHSGVRGGIVGSGEKWLETPTRTWHQGLRAQSHILSMGYSAASLAARSVGVDKYLLNEYVGA